MKNLKITVVGMNKAVVVDENGKEFEARASFHARTLKGEYKYHEVYVYLNEIDEFKDEFKAPKTLGQKWKQVDERKFKGPKLLGYTETIGRNNRCMYDINELSFE